MNNLTPFSQNAELNELFAQRDLILTESVGEITPDNESVLNELSFRIRGILTQSKDEVSRLCSYLDWIDLEVQYCEQHIKKIQAYMKQKKATQEWVLINAKFLIEQKGEPLVGNMGNKISLRKSESVLVVCAAEELPAQYRRAKVEVSADKALIKEDIKKGIDIPGCSIVQNLNPTWK